MIDTIIQDCQCDCGRRTCAVCSKMTTLERAARAAAVACEQVRPSDEHDAEAWTFIARAVLMAVRDLDQKAILNGETAWHEVRSENAYAAWVTMIDAILAEGE